MVGRTFTLLTPALRGIGFGLGTLLIASCGGGDGNGVAPSGELSVDCQLSSSLLTDGGAGGPDAIPALVSPKMVDADNTSELSYLLGTDRVLGVEFNGDARAYPHNIFWWHEVVNDRVGGVDVAITFCPLTGSGLLFDPMVQGRKIEFGVSGLLFANNLVLFDRDTRQVYGPQLDVTGRCSAFKGASINLLEVTEMTWARWKELHPNTTVVSENTNFTRPYTVYPYGSYDNIANNTLLFPMDTDNSRPIKERVLGIRVGEDGGKGYPFGELEALGTTSVVNDQVSGQDVVIFYEAANRKSAHAFTPRAGGQNLTFEVVNEQYRDIETGSTWDLLGRAIDGPLDGERLARLTDAYIAFWFAWQFFQPDSDIFIAG